MSFLSLRDLDHEGTKTVDVSVKQHAYKICAIAVL